MPRFTCQRRAATGAAMVFFTGCGPARLDQPIQRFERPIAEWTVDTAHSEVAANLRASAATARVRPVGALSLGGGRTAVLDGNAAKVLYFSRHGALERTVELQPAGTELRLRADKLVRLAGDTIGAIASGRAFVLDERGEIMRAFNAAELRAPGAPRFRMVLAPLAGGKTVLAFVDRQEPPAADATRWVDSIRVVVVDGDMNILNELGLWPNVFIEARSGRPHQVWFAPHLVVASRDSVIYHGFGSDYRIDATTSTGRIHRSFVRPWNRVPVTPADIDAYVEGWSRNWMKGTAAEVERGKRDMRTNPFFPYVPSFSEFLVTSEGELWVRSPNLTDAQSAGELYSIPLVPSHWSIFSQDGRWIGQATLPALSHPRDVREGFVLTVEGGANAGKVVRRRLQRVETVERTP